MRVTIVGPATAGGIADYAHAQANALADLGAEIRLCCPAEHAAGRPARYEVLPVFSALALSSALPAALRRARSAAGILACWTAVARVLDGAPPHPVLTHFSEYLAPLWAWRFQRLKRRGFTFHTVLHDPQRSYQVGPAAWHRRSVREAFALYDTVFVHGAERGDAPAHVPLVTVPIGAFRSPTPVRSREAVRAEFGVPAGAPLVTQFGFLSDYKNIDLAIRALPHVPGVHLLIAGAEQPGARPASAYRALAAEMGVAERCHFRIGFHDATAAADFLAASDVLMLAYSATFVSASGVLASAVHHKVPALVSGGLGETRALVEHYGLGRWVEPDDVAAIAAGLAGLLAAPPAPDWAGYDREQSWRRNAEIVLARLAKAAP